MLRCLVASISDLICGEVEQVRTPIEAFSELKGVDWQIKNNNSDEGIQQRIGHKAAKTVSQLSAHLPPEEDIL